MSTYSFGKKYRLSCKKGIALLFDQGRRLKLSNVLLRYIPHPLPQLHHQVLFTVSKRLIPHATTRNRTKRQMREAYRRCKPLWELKEGQQSLLLSYSYVGKSPSPCYHDLAEAIAEGVQAMTLAAAGGDKA
jgi:ribonuclease P protein component